MFLPTRKNLFSALQYVENEYNRTCCMRLAQIDWDSVSCFLVKRIAPSASSEEPRAIISVYSLDPTPVIVRGKWTPLIETIKKSKKDFFSCRMPHGLFPYPRTNILAYIKDQAVSDIRQAAFFPNRRTTIEFTSNPDGPVNFLTVCEPLGAIRSKRKEMGLPTLLL